ncbi:uncharacterized protein Dwil_GK27437, partial [Drosophila willistoni]
MTKLHRANRSAPAATAVPAATVVPTT